MSQSLTERYDDRIAGVLSCYDRLVITGTLPVVCYAAGMTGYLNAKGIRIFDYPGFAKTLRDRVRDRAASLAARAGGTAAVAGRSAHGTPGPGQPRTEIASRVVSARVMGEIVRAAAARHRPADVLHRRRLAESGPAVPSLRLGPVR